MIIVDPVALGDAAFSRASSKWVFDRTGTLVEVPANVPAVTYDPADLSKAPYVLIEPEAANHIRNNTMQGVAVGTPGTLPANWGLSGNGGLSREIVGKGTEDGIDYVDVRVYGTAANVSAPEVYFTFETSTSISAVSGQNWFSSFFVRIVAGSMDGVAGFEHFLIGYTSAGSLSQATSAPITVDSEPLRLRRKSYSRELIAATTASIQNRFDVNLTPGAAVDITLRIGLPQLERDRVTSPIKTTNAAVTRAADAVGNNAGLLYSNVPIQEPAYDVNATYAKDAAVHDPVTKVVYWSMLDANKGNPLSDPSKWNKRTATNRWAMLDDQNNTQTSNAEEILLVLSPRAISQGLYMGNLDGAEVRVSMVDIDRGLVFSQVQSQLVPRSASSFFRWCFNRIRRKTYFLTLQMPVFANPLVTISIRKPGGVAKCGMCMLGPAVDVGLSHYGLSTELKDFSTTTFNPDGTSSTVVRGYAKRMSVDVSVRSERVDDVEEQLISYRQKNVVWVGAAMYGSAMLCGKYSSFKKVIESHPFSKMALQIEGVVS